MNIEIGDVVKGIVTGIEDYGIFINIDDKYSGLIHISEISDDFVKNVNDYVKIGDEIYAIVIEIDRFTNHLKLSIKNMNYKDSDSPIKETRLGFLPLKNKLDSWIEDKLKIYKK